MRFSGIVLYAYLKKLSRNWDKIIVLVLVLDTFYVKYSVVLEK